MFLNLLPTTYLLFLPTIYALQHQYKFDHEYAKLTYINEELIPYHNFVFSKMNRTTAALNVTFRTIGDIISDKTGRVQITGFQFRSNEYRMGPIRFDMGLCSALKSKQFDLPNILFANSNMTKCPLRTGTYYINKISPNAVNFPPLIPEGKWMLQLEIVYLDNLAATIQWFVN